MTVHAYDEIRFRAISLVEEQQIDPELDLGRVREVVSTAVEDYQRSAHLGVGRPLSKPAEMVERVVRSLAEFGPLSALLARSDVEEVFIEGQRVSFLMPMGGYGGSTSPRPRPRTGMSSSVYWPPQIAGSTPRVRWCRPGSWGVRRGSPRWRRPLPMSCRSPFGGMRCDERHSTISPLWVP